MKFNVQLDKLGTETAFAVSADAEAWSKKGHKIYPFHLGDMNIPTPENIRQATYKYMTEGHNGYCPAAGIPELREALAMDVGAKRNVNYSAENVVIQPGGKPTIWKFIAAVMNRGQGVLYPSPGYPIYESQIEYQGGVALPYRYVETKNGFAIDLDQLRSSISNDTVALIYNNYQNPLSAASSQEEIETLADIAIDHDLWVLSDDAYYEIRYTDDPPRSIVSIPGMQDRTVILYSFSKKYAMTGWRIGASIGPKELASHIAKLNVNDESCTNHFIQWAMIEALHDDISEPKNILDELCMRRDTAVTTLNSIDGISIPSPESTFYLFPNITAVMNKKGFKDVEQFRIAVLEQTGVSFCTRNHFGRPGEDEKEHFIRFAYSGIGVHDIREGIEKFKSWIVA